MSGSTVGLSTGQQFNSMYDLLMGNETPSTKDGAEEQSQPNPKIAANSPDLVVIRHGDTKCNEEGTAHGWSNDSLTDKGRQDVEKQTLKDKPDILVTSDLKRATETADILSKNHNIPVVEKNPDFRTWNIGSFEGHPSDMINPLLNKYVDNPDTKVPGGESFNDFKSRVLTGLSDLQTQYPGIKVGLVTHSKTQEMLDHVLEGKDYKTDTPEPTSHEKTMKLAMNDEDKQHSIFGPQIQPPGGFGSGGYNPNYKIPANENVGLAERVQRILDRIKDIPPDAPGGKFKPYERQDLEEYTRQYENSPQGKYDKAVDIQQRRNEIKPLEAIGPKEKVPLPRPRKAPPGSYEDSIRAIQEIGKKLGTHADFNKFEAEARPSREIEDRRVKDIDAYTDKEKKEMDLLIGKYLLKKKLEE